MSGKGGGVEISGGVVKKRESSNFRSPEVGISVIMSKSRGVLPDRSDGVRVVPFRGLNLWIGTA